MAFWQAPLGRLERGDEDIVHAQLRVMQDAQLFRVLRHQLPPPAAKPAPANDLDVEGEANSFR